MAIRFQSASSQYLSRAPSITAAPFTFGAWVRPSAVTNIDTILGLLGTFNFEFGFYFFPSNRWIVQNASGNVTGGTVTVGAWHYVLLRFRSNTNQRFSALEPTGIITHLQNTNDAALTAFTEMTLGARPAGVLPSDCDMAEMFLANADVQAADAATDEVLLRQLAYRGPFSVPHIRKDIIEYRSFRSRVTEPRFGEVYWGARGPQTWTNTGGVTIGPHVKLPTSYRRPIQDDGVITVLSTFNVDEGDATVDITGGTVENDILTANFHDDDPDGPATGITYQWEADGTPIGGATSSTYQLTASEVGTAITVVVSYTDGEGFAESIESAATATITAFVSNTGTDVKGLSIGKGLSPWKGLSKDKGLSWRKGL